jgi:hypothetical protein
MLTVENAPVAGSKSPTLLALRGTKYIWPFFASTPPEYFQRPEMTLEMSRAEKAPVTGSNMPMLSSSFGTM